MTVVLDLFDPPPAPTPEVKPRTHWALYTQQCGHLIRTCVHVKRGLLAADAPGVRKLYRGGLCANCAMAIARMRRPR